MKCILEELENDYISRGDYVLSETCGSGCPCRQSDSHTHLNLVRNTMIEDEFGGKTPPSELPETRYINIRGREEHEAIIRDAALCKELGLDQAYEIIVYLKRWGSWLCAQ
jgi:hypothetical protein